MPARWRWVLIEDGETWRPYARPTFSWLAWCLVDARGSYFRG